VEPDQVLTHASSTEDVRAAYRQHNVRFGLDPVGKLTLRMEVALGGPVCGTAPTSPYSRETHNTRRLRLTAAAGREPVVEVALV
jgi:hypothetical protein